MFDEMWAYIQNPENRTVISWAGGGVLVALGLIAKIIKWFFPKKEVSHDTKTKVYSRKGSVAIGGNAQDSPINVGNKKRK